MSPDGPTADQDEADAGHQFQRDHGQVFLRHGAQGDGKGGGGDQGGCGGQENQEGVVLFVRCEQDGRKLCLVPQLCQEHSQEYRY